MTTLSDRLDFPNLKKIVLAEVTAGLALRFWTLRTGCAYTWEATTDLRVTSVKGNGVPLTLRDSAPLVEANAGSYYWDQAAGKVYAHPTGSVSPYTQTVQAIVLFCWATQPRIYNGIYYEDRISSLPTLSQRIEAKFGDPGQIGNGSVTFRNNDGYFDRLTDLQWDAGRVTLKLGADDPMLSASATGAAISDGATTDTALDGALTDTLGDGALIDLGAAVAFPVHAQMAYADFEQLGVWVFRKWDLNEEEFTASIEEPKGNLKKKIPLEFYDRATYPNIAESAIGKPIPRSYGRVYDVEPVCIDTTARQFKVAGHAVHSLAGVRVFDGATSAWNDVPFATTDEANGEFTLAGADWDGDAQVAVDLIGRMRDSGDPMDNWSDVLDDLLRYVGETDATINTTAFAAARTALILGTDSDLVDVSRCRVSLDLRETVELYDVVTRCNAAVGAYIQTGFDGKFRLDVFEPAAGETAVLFDDSSIKSFVEEVNAETIYSKVRALYQRRTAQDYSQITLQERAEAQYLQGSASAVLREFGEPLPLDLTADAEYVAQRTLIAEGERVRVWKSRLSHRAWTLMPGQYVRIDWTRGAINSVFEVLEVRRNLSDTKWVEVTLGNLHGFGDNVGFLTDDAPTFPASLGGGSCAAWDDAWAADLKRWARQNVAFVTDDYGFADTTDADSLCGKVV